MSDPKPQMPSGGGTSKPGVNPCEDLPVYWGKSQKYVAPDGSVLEQKNGENKEISYVNAMNKLARARNNGATIAAG